MRPRVGRSLGVTLATVMAMGACATTPATTVAVPNAGSHQSAAIRNCLNGVTGPGALAQTIDRTQQPSPGTYTIRCGDQGTGITRINNDHPIQADPDDFLRCVTETIAYGSSTAGNPPGTTTFADFYDGPTAISYVVVDDNSHAVLTAYTNKGARGNDWPGCVGK